MPRLANDPRVAKLLANPAGRVGFAAAFGFMFFQTCANFRTLVDMAGAWQEHTDHRRELGDNHRPVFGSYVTPAGDVEELGDLEGVQPDGQTPGTVDT